MPITREQIRKDIEEKKSRTVYYSSGTLWWTHLDSDVIEATKRGRKYMDARNKQFFEDPSKSDLEKAKLRSLLRSLDEAKKSRGGVELPCDPIGSPLYKMDDPMKWLNQSESKPDFCGRHGLQAFVLTHHQNCQDYFSNKWEGYNDYIDRKLN